MHRIIKVTRRRASSERGASLVEYALLVALIAVVCIAAVTFLGTSGAGKLNGAGSAIQGTQASDEQPQCVSFPTEHYFLYSDGTRSSYMMGPCP